MASLCDFLRVRGVPEEAISFMEDQKGTCCGSAPVTQSIVRGSWVGPGPQGSQVRVRWGQVHKVAVCRLTAKSYH
ncbi:unnamed protein product [Boreogadus saida]